MNIVPSAYSTTPCTLLEMVTFNKFWISNTKNGFHNDDIELYNSAGGGLFSTEISDNDQPNKLVLKGTTSTNANILIAVLKSGYWELILKLVSSGKRVHAVKIEPPQVLWNGYKIPQQFSEDTSLVVCLKCNPNWEVAIEVKMCGVLYGKIHWNPSSLTMTDSLKGTNEITQTEFNNYRPCAECPVTSFNGEGHLPPCPPKCTISRLRKDAYSHKMDRVLQIRFENPRNHIQVLNNEIGNFIDVYGDTMFNNEVIEGIFTFKELPSGKKLLSFDSVTINRFAILFAFLHKGSWRVRLSLVLTTQNGVLGFKATSTLYAHDQKFQVPKNWIGNTVLFFGIRSNNEDIDMTLRIHAAEMYEAQVSWDHLHDDVLLSDNLIPTNSKSRPFPGHLYEGVAKKLKGIISQQRRVPELQPQVVNATTSTSTSPPNDPAPTEQTTEIVESDTTEAAQYNAFQFWHSQVISLCNFLNYI